MSLRTFIQRKQTEEFLKKAPRDDLIKFIKREAFLDNIVAILFVILVFVFFFSYVYMIADVYENWTSKENYEHRGQALQVMGQDYCRENELGSFVQLQPITQDGEKVNIVKLTCEKAIKIFK